MTNCKNNQISLLIIDDDNDYVDSLYRDAQMYNIELKHANNLEEGIEIYENSDIKTYSGVILDVVCMKEKSQRVPNNSFIIAASRYFSEKAPNLPIAVITGEPGQYKNLKDLFKGSLKVYSKGRDEEEMLIALKNNAIKLL